eukprot:SAG31_NODE_3075_length_4712_cov_2.262302_4_plen_54_part_00
MARAFGRIDADCSGLISMSEFEDWFWNFSGYAEQLQLFLPDRASPDEPDFEDG